MHGDDVASAGVSMAADIASKATEAILELLKVGIENKRYANRNSKEKPKVLSGGEVTYQRLKEGGEITSLPSFPNEDYGEYLKRAKKADIPVAAIQEQGKENTLTLFFNKRDEQAVNAIVRDIVQEKLRQPEQAERMITIDRDHVEAFQTACSAQDIPVNFMQTKDGVKCIFNEQVFKLFFKFILAKVLVQNAHGLMGIIYNGFNQIAAKLGEANYGFLDSFTPESLVVKPDSAGFLNLNYLVKYLEAMPTYLILMGACWIINLILIGRLFEIVVYTVISPIPLSTFAGEGWHDVAKAFIKSYAAVCLQGVVVIVMFYAFAQIVELLGGTSTVGITITTLSLALGVAKSGQWARQALGA